MLLAHWNLAEALQRSDELTLVACAVTVPERPVRYTSTSISPSESVRWLRLYTCFPFLETTTVHTRLARGVSRSNSTSSFPVSSSRDNVTLLRELPVQVPRLTTSLPSAATMGAMAGRRRIAMEESFMALVLEGGEMRWLLFHRREFPVRSQPRQ
jgi:hypothetical protein